MNNIHTEETKEVWVSDWIPSEIFRKERRDRRVKATENNLIRNKIPYTHTTIKNVVEITAGDKTIYLSLKSDTVGQGSIIYRFRLKGSSEWHTARKDKFINRVKEVIKIYSHKN